MQIINATLNGVALLVYDNSAVPRGCHTIFDYQIRGSQNIAKVPLEIYEPLFQSMVTSSLCQRLNSRQLTQIRAAEAREKSSAKREHERRRRESPPEAKGERSEPFAGGTRDSAKRNRVFVIMAKFLSPSSHVTCQNWIRPFTKKHRFIAQIDSARSNIASTA